MAECTHFTGEQAFGRGVMQVNVIAIGEHKLHQPQGIAR